MSRARESFDPSVFHEPMAVQMQVFIDEHRLALAASLDGLTEEQARRRLVGSKTTLLGLVKHAAFAERVWFGETIGLRPRAEMGLVATPDESFDLDPADTIASVLADYHRACADSRATAATLTLDTVATGNRRGPLPVRWIYLHLLREVAQHCGHADILREQVVGT